MEKLSFVRWTGEPSRLMSTQGGQCGKASRWTIHGEYFRVILNLTRGDQTAVAVTAKFTYLPTTDTYTPTTWRQGKQTGQPSLKTPLKQLWASMVPGHNPLSLTARSTFP